MEKTGIYPKAFGSSSLSSVDPEKYGAKKVILLHIIWSTTKSQETRSDVGGFGSSDVDDAAAVADGWRLTVCFGGRFFVLRAKKLN